MPTTSELLNQKLLSRTLNPPMLQQRVSPAADTVTLLATIPAGYTKQGAAIHVMNAGSADVLCQCYMAMQGATHAATQAVGPKFVVPPNQSMTCNIPLTMTGGDVIRVWTDGTGNTTTFTISEAVR